MDVRMHYKLFEPKNTSKNIPKDSILQRLGSLYLEQNIWMDRLLPYGHFRKSISRFSLDIGR